MLSAQLHQAKPSTLNPRHLDKTELGYINQYDNLILSSAFQPIFSIPHRRIVGYEALLRAHDVDGQAVSPWTVLHKPICIKEHLSLDRSCRWLHSHNFAQQREHEHWLFMNLNTQCLVAEKPDAGFMMDLFDSTGLEPRQMVIEILESEIQQSQYLQDLITHFRHLGCLIAIDDFGSGYSNFDRIWQLQPDIVKIDRNLIKQAGQSAKVERILSGIVSLIHETGSLVVIEGIETEQEGRIAIASNADMVQGFYFAKPNIKLLENADFEDKVDKLTWLGKIARNDRNQLLQKQLNDFEQAFAIETDRLVNNIPFEQCGSTIFADERVSMAYLLDEEGYQMGKTLYSPQNSEYIDRRFEPFQALEASNWGHRHYHYRALNHPGEIQISRPYLSVTGFHLCVTVSQALQLDGKWGVFCCDLNWSDEDSSSF